MTDGRARPEARLGAGPGTELRSERARANSLRLRSLGWFALAVVYAALAHLFAARVGGALGPGELYAAGSRLLFVFLLWLGFAVMAAVQNRPEGAGAAVGLPLRPGKGREWALGAALGWAGVVACVAPIALFGGLLVTLSSGGTPYQAWPLLGNLLGVLLSLAATALADELLFRGYPFQRLIEAAGPTSAALLMTALFAYAREGPASTPGSVLATVLLGLLLAVAYLRTRAVWVGWGFGFAWMASMAVLFGLPISGSTGFSPIFSAYAAGPALLTGGAYGPEGSALASLVLLLLLWVTARATRELRHRWAMPEIVGAGLPVNLDALTERQHREAMGPGGLSAPPAAVTLVQIQPVTSREPAAGLPAPSDAPASPQSIPPRPLPLDRSEP